jgi:hypothetical protein
MAYGREPHVEIPVICPPPSAVREVYVNDLPEWATDGWLREQFESAGDIVKAAKVMEHGIDGKPYGYVQIEESPLGCLLVPNVPDPSVLQDQVYGGAASCNVFVNGLPHSFADYDVSCLFGEYDMPEILVNPSHANNGHENHSRSKSGRRTSLPPLSQGASLSAIPPLHNIPALLAQTQATARIHGVDPSQCRIMCQFQRPFLCLSGHWGWGTSWTILAWSWKS